MQSVTCRLQGIFPVLRSIDLLHHLKFCRANEINSKILSRYLFFTKYLLSLHQGTRVSFVFV